VEIRKLEEEIKQIKSHLSFLENRIIEIQQNCDHQFCDGNQYYEKCIKCNKVNVLYY
jgi:hypothetical protein